jgi:hypothetical protein
MTDAAARFHCGAWECGGVAFGDAGAAGRARVAGRRTDGMGDLVARQLAGGDRMTSGIFISYRRLDSKSDARSICQRLEKTFGKRNVFIDVDSIKPGEDFQSALKHNLEKCDTMVVVIGPRWLELMRSNSRQYELDPR